MRAYADVTWYVAVLAARLPVPDDPFFESNFKDQSDPTAQLA